MLEKLRELRELAKDPVRFFKYVTGELREPELECPYLVRFAKPARIEPRNYKGPRIVPFQRHTAVVVRSGEPIKMYSALHRKVLIFQSDTLQFVSDKHEFKLKVFRERPNGYKDELGTIGRKRTCVFATEASNQWFEGFVTRLDAKFHSNWFGLEMLKHSLHLPPDEAKEFWKANAPWILKAIFPKIHAQEIVIDSLRAFIPQIEWHPTPEAFDFEHIILTTVDDILHWLDLNASKQIVEIRPLDASELQRWNQTLIV